MDSSSSNSSGQHKPGLLDQRKRKRMISNRESARRSRLKKQNHLHGLMAQVSELRKGNQQILSALTATSQSYARLDSENAILRAQLAELSHRLRSLDEIASFVDQAELTTSDYGMSEPVGFGSGYWNCSSQPVMMSADHGFLY